ncbi:putative xyloglucan-specific endo-beta-1,4-glucanase A [Pseudocercospora fuligena]|uniref:Putative xyloglucan-specific endo-beta-1,4-glucanase A n=1 Tax=Pseudocercospora fuligena TaxID=685502 RepID=A0A8H6VDX5_9PEZI|nr:putative xyloglucan-specific endo-beta-1,4-glucanase A [Pseudocercospora fuligena]
MISELFEMYANFILLPSLLAAVASGILLDHVEAQSDGLLGELETRGQEGLTPSIGERNILEARDICDKDAKQPAGRHYTLYNNLWNLQPGQKSPQCSNVDSVNGNVVSWRSKFSWDYGNSQVKSFSSLQYHYPLIELNKIASMRTTYNWDMKCSSKVDASIVYDLFAGPKSRDGKCRRNKTNEIMLWLGQFGVNKPIAENYSPYTAHTKNIAIFGTKNRWDLYKGKNGDTTVHSFVPRDGKGRWLDLKNWTGNLKPFIEYLYTHGEISGDYCLIESNAGTEPTSGRDCYFKVDRYDLSIERKR